MICQDLALSTTPMSAATSATRLDLIALAVAGMLPLAWSGGQVERAREAVEEVSAPVQHCDHAGRDGAIRGELDGDDPEDSQTRRKGARSTGPAPRLTPRGKPRREDVAQDAGKPRGELSRAARPNEQVADDQWNQSGQR
jgi:hypothetical protein